VRSVKAGGFLERAPGQAGQVWQATKKDGLRPNKTRCYNLGREKSCHH